MVVKVSRFKNLEPEIEGDDFTYSLKFTDSDGNNKDITNWTIWFTMKEKPTATDGNAVVQKKVTSHTDPTKGETEVDVSSSDLEDSSGNYYYDFQYKDDSGDIVTFLLGEISIEQGITDSTS